MKKAGKAILAGFAALILIVGAYAAYVLTDYHRIGDHAVAVSGEGEAAALDTEYTLISYNIGFGAYTPDFGFFMDGGTESRAASKESVERVTGEIAEFLALQDADFLMLEEVDMDATRSHGVDQVSLLQFELPDTYTFTFAENYDSPYLFYPIFDPVGKSRSGMLTASRFAVTESYRRELPVETNLYKLLDLDRCYAVNRVPVENDRELVLYTVHLSAYTSDGTVATEQLKMLLGDMQSEAEKGNYVICGGDFNKDLLGDSSAVFGVSGEGHTWAQPFPEDLLQGTELFLADLGGEGAVPSCRNADGPYHEGQFVVTVDGFIISNNVAVAEAEVLDTDFAWSDHNPVRLRFSLGR